MTRPRVALIGSHRAIAPLLAEALDEHATLERYTTLDHVGADSQPLSTERLAGAHVVVLAMAGDAAIAAAVQARSTGAVIIDVVGALPDALVVWSHRALPERLERGGAYAVMPGLAGPIGAAIAALSPLKPRLAVVSTFESAAALDTVGMDALTDQVRSLLAFREPDPGALGERLAFNVVPAIGDDDAAAELRMTAQIRAAAGAGAPLVRLSRHVVPTYSGEGAALDLAVEGTPTLDAVAEALGTLLDTRVGRADAPTPHDASDRDEVLIGRLRVGPGRVALWIAADRLRSTAAVPVARLVARAPL